MDAKYKLFKPGQTVVDLGYAPGSWSQVAMERTKPTGRVVGVDVIPAQPPRGVSTIQGNFLSRRVRDMLVEFLVDGGAKGAPPQQQQRTADGQDDSDAVVFEKPSYVDMERILLQNRHGDGPKSRPGDDDGLRDEENGENGLRLVDVVLSDMSEPWAQTAGFWKNSLSNPYYRMMNTSGISFRDHASSMDLCNAALTFASDTLRSGGHFLCKIYQGGEDKLLERKLRMMFAKVHREKPEASRSESRELYFVALGRNGKVTLGEVEASLARPPDTVET